MAPKKSTGINDENTVKPPRRGMENLRPWKPGESGNPSGRPKSKHISDMYERILSDPRNNKLIEIAVAKALKKGGMAMVLQLKEMADRTEGKVTQPIEADVTVNLSDAIAAARKRAGK